MKKPKNNYSFTLHPEIDRMGKASQQTPAKAIVDGHIEQRVMGDFMRARVEKPKKFFPKAGGFPVIPQIPGNCIFINFGKK